MTNNKEKETDLSIYQWNEYSGENEINSEDSNNKGRFKIYNSSKHKDLIVII